jgi:hypothetical protein
VEEAVKAGIDDILMITGRSKRALEDHFDHEPGLERTLALKGDAERLALVQEASDLGPIHYVRQGVTGDKLSYLKAVITLASERLEFGEDLKTWLNLGRLATDAFVATTGPPLTSGGPVVVCGSESALGELKAFNCRIQTLCDQIEQVFPVPTLCERRGPFPQLVITEEA